MNTLNDSQSLKLRPRFIVHSRLPIEEICERFRTPNIDDSVFFTTTVRGEYVTIFPIDKYRHYWSPHFSLSMETSEKDDYNTDVFVLYGPSPEVWTMFVFFYAIVILLVVIVTVIGLANRSIGESGVILWAIPFLLLIFVSMYAGSYFGQKKGYDQVERIYNYINSVLLSD